MSLVTILGANRSPARADSSRMRETNGPSARPGEARRARPDVECARVGDPHGAKRLEVCERAIERARSRPSAPL